MIKWMVKQESKANHCTIHQTMVNKYILLAAIVSTIRDRAVGATALTKILSFLPSIARVFVSPTTPIFAAL